ncbi:MAG TPA: hypothetical protein VKY31_13065 [Terriglobia bacterium]|nr:hypothetical protein [Terriglobia bacterium]
MQRFKPGDRLFILPKFAHLYPHNTGIVRSVSADPFRAAFNSYSLEFSDNSIANAFEFQVIQEPPNTTTRIADVVFDSRTHMAQTRARGRSNNPQIVLHTDRFDIDITIKSGTSGSPEIMGQVLENGTGRFVAPLEIQLLRDAILLARTMSEVSGVFRFINVPAGPLNILVLIPQHLLQILGTFSI